MSTQTSNTTTIAREGVVYLASTTVGDDDNGYTTGIASALCLRSKDRRPYKKWATLSRDHQSRDRASVGILSHIIKVVKGIQSRTDLKIYTHRSLNVEDILNATRSNGRINITVVKPEPDSPQASYMEKVKALSKWEAKHGGGII